MVGEKIMHGDLIFMGIYFITLGLVFIIFRKFLGAKTSEFWDSRPWLGMQGLYKGPIGQTLFLFGGFVSIVVGIIILFQ